MTYTLQLFPHLGSFASNKDTARALRQSEIIPRLAKGEGIILDFTGIDGSTQSLIHALIAEPLQLYGHKALSLLQFKSANPIVKTLIGLVIDYSLIHRN
ncbi:DUF4325 domain-containing protein [Candidatus Woesebacteria bacterium]|nr:DUF4325 domain-containing protein [Candidatus Woesebacteria bacterium]